MSDVVGIWNRDVAIHPYLVGNESPQIAALHIFWDTIAAEQILASSVDLNAK